MKRTIMLSVAAFVFVLCAATATVHAGEDSWRPYHEPAYNTETSKGSYVLLCFTEKGCPACLSKRNALAPVIAEGQYANITPFKVDMAEQAGLSAKFGVTSHPTIILLKNKKEVGRISGDITEEQFRALLAKAT